MKKTFQLLVLLLFLATIPVSAYADAWDDGWEVGFEEGYHVGWADAECAMEYEGNGASSQKQDSSNNGVIAYNDGYKAGYSKGVHDSIEEESDGSKNSETSWIVYAVPFVVLLMAYRIGKFVGEDQSAKTIGRLHTENMELHAKLHKIESAKQ